MDMEALAALMGEDLTAEQFSDVWVVLPDEAALPLVGEARRLADGLGCYVHVITARDAHCERAFAYGADKVHVTAAPLAFIRTVKPEFIFLPATHDAEAAQLAEFFNAGLVTQAIEVSVDEATRALRAARLVYAGDYGLAYQITSPVKAVTLVARALPAHLIDPTRRGEIFMEETESASAVRDLGPVDYAPYTGRPLQHAQRIVAVGRGLRDDEGWALAQQLAQKIGAQLAGDRSARDLGWIDEAREVAWGREPIAPQVYVALGIRGDTAHNIMLGRAQMVAAVHPNPAASVLALADLPVVGDPKDFIRAVLDALE